MQQQQHLPCSRSMSAKILNRILIVDNKVENQLQYFQAFDADQARNVIPMKF